MWAKALAAHVGRVRLGHHVGDLAHVVRYLRQARQLLVAHAVDAHLQLEVGDDADEVGVAAALAVAVDRALHLRRPGLDRGQGIGHRQARVIVGVDAHRGAQAARRRDRLDDSDW